MKFYTESSPHIKDGDTTNKIMLRVIIALLPAVIYSIVLFGARVIVLYLAAIITCIVSTIIVKKVRKKPLIPDYAVTVTAILLVMTLPPSATITMVVIGSVIAIVFAKEVFGGLGSNIFNPALVGRAFLQVAFPAQMTMYTPPKNVPFLGVFENILNNMKGYGDLDYVSAWYKKSAELIKGTKIKAAFVSTNSITQGTQVSILWENLIKECGVYIHFAHRTFEWNNEAKGKAHVYCVIIGFANFNYLVYSLSN